MLVLFVGKRNDGREGMNKIEKGAYIEVCVYAERVIQMLRRPKKMRSKVECCFLLIYTDT